MPAALAGLALRVSPGLVGGGGLLPQFTELGSPRGVLVRSSGEPEQPSLGEWEDPNPGFANLRNWSPCPVGERTSAPLRHKYSVLTQGTCAAKCRKPRQAL